MLSGGGVFLILKMMNIFFSLGKYSSVKSVLHMKQ